MVDLLRSTPNRKLHAEEIAARIGLDPDMKHNDLHIRYLALELSLAGYPIVADCEGFWFSTVPSEIRDYASRREAQAEAAYLTTKQRPLRMRKVADPLDNDGPI
jgi:hypothetical protein